MAGQLTLALIKPHVYVGRQSGQIIARLEKLGFAIILGKTTQLTREGAEDFYSEHKGKDFYDNLTQVMSSGPMWALVLAKPNAVGDWRGAIGATNPVDAEVGTIRHEFGDHKNITNNAVHGSATDHDAKREINFFFAREIKLAERIDALDNKPQL